MIAMAVSFPQSFLSESIFIFYGNNVSELVDSFQEVQNVEQHIMNIRGYISFVDRKEDYDFTENFYEAVLENNTISIDEAKRFFMLCPEVCKVLDFVEGDNALQHLKEKYPQALCR